MENSSFIALSTSAKAMRVHHPFSS